MSSRPGPSNSPGKSPNPLTIIYEVVRRVPAARFLLVLTGIVAIGALSLLLFWGNWKAALIATFVTFILAGPTLLLLSATRIVKRRGISVLIYTMLWALLCLTLSIFSLLITTTVFRWPRSLPEILGSGKVVGIQDASSVLESAIQAKKSYALLSIVDYINIEPTGTNRDFFCKRRIVYTILPFHAWNEKAEHEFIEQYGTLYGNAFPPVHWYGTEKEVIYGDLKRPEGRPYDVRFAAEAFAPRTVVTGCNALYHPTNEVRTVPYFNTSPLASNEDFFVYPAIDDYILSYSIVLESRGFDIEFLSAIGQSQKGVRLDPEETRSNHEASPETRSVSARWSNLVPGDGVQLVYRFNPTSR
jgi:hypothetical protein